MVPHSADHWSGWNECFADRLPRSPGCWRPNNVNTRDLDTSAAREWTPIHGNAADIPGWHFRTKSDATHNAQFTATAFWRRNIVRFIAGDWGQHSAASKFWWDIAPTGAHITDNTLARFARVVAAHGSSASQAW